jgi:hypothetical protein
MKELWLFQINNNTGKWHNVQISKNSVTTTPPPPPPPYGHKNTRKNFQYQLPHLGSATGA